MKALVRRVRGALSPDLLKPAFRRPGAHRLAGHCYVASEALYHLGARDAGYRPHRMQVGGVTHWWLERRDGARIDATAEQFPFRIDYTQGRCAGFLTREPSKRARTLMERVHATVA